MRFATASCVTLCCLSSLNAAEPAMDRYDLGQRLIMLERAWDAQPQAAARHRVMPVLKAAMPQLLSGNFVDAAASFDRARLLLASPEPTAAHRWAASLVIQPQERLVDPVTAILNVDLLAGYAAGVPVPPNAVVRLSLSPTEGGTSFAHTEVAIERLPVTCRLPIDKAPQGDHLLRAEVVVDGKTIGEQVVGVSVATRHLERLLELYKELKRGGGSTENRTLRSLISVLSSIRSPETNYPAARLLAEAEALARALAANETYYGPKRTGQFWITLVAGADIAPIRLFVPEDAKAGKPIPLVVALHGAGGSENLFFDAYGYGLIARLARERGWMVVAPRAGGLFDGAAPVAAIVDELARLYPIDPKRVFIVGHSMGAMQAVTLAQQSPGKYAAIAALGGGGTVDKPEAFKTLPIFVGCGVEDFLIGGARGLAAAFKKANAANLTYKEYPGVEHILIVQEALPDVFRFFAEAVGDTRTKRR